MLRFPLLATAVALLSLVLNALSQQAPAAKDALAQPQSGSQAEALPVSASFAQRLSDAAIERSRKSVRYDPAYVVIDYPGGDVPADTGVCTDVVIRSYRTLGFDLQRHVHEDMLKNFSAYPKNWGLKRADKNIDHRRVPNLETFLERQGAAAAISEKPEDYRAGDLVAWDLNGNGLWHIGIVVAAPDGQPSSADTKCWFVHNIGGGPLLDHDIFQWKIVGHYRWHPKKPIAASH